MRYYRGRARGPRRLRKPSSPDRYLIEASELTPFGGVEPTAARDDGEVGPFALANKHTRSSQRFRPTGFASRKSWSCIALGALLLMGLLIPTSAQDAGEHWLFPVRKDNHIAFIDAQGRMTLEPHVEESGDFSNGLSAVCIKGRYGFMDMSGNVVIQPIFAEVGPFSEGLASATLAPDVVGKLQKKRIGYINSVGKYIIAPEFDFAYNFQDGMAQISEVGRHGYVDRSGKVFYLEPGITWWNDFSEGLAAVGYGPGRVGFIDKTGRLVMEALFSGAGRFSEGLAKVRIGDEWGYIDKSGKIVIGPQFDSCGDFSQGLAPVNQQGKYGYINETGLMVIEPQFVEAREFSEGLAAVRIKGAGDSIRQEGDTTLIAITGPFGFIDKTGRMVIQPTFTQVGNFSHGLAMINLGDETPGPWGKWAYINKTGKFVWQPKETK